MRRLRVFTWQVHGNYLWYLSQARHDFVIPVKSPPEFGYSGGGDSFPFGANVIEIPAEEARLEQFDCILFQHRQNYLVDQFEILSDLQRGLPKVYVEHDPPLESPTDTKHWVDDPNVLLVHVTPFNQLMWDNGRTPTRVIDHGVMIPDDVQYVGDIPRGVVVINDLRERGRRLGVDVFEAARQEVELDLIGMGAEELGGHSAIRPPDLPACVAHYRFFFNPIRFTSLGLAVCEAMTIGLPIVGLATTEMVTAIQNGVSGYVDTRMDRLIERMRELIANPDEAMRLGRNARAYALERFHIQRFADDWTRTLSEVAGRMPAGEQLSSTRSESEEVDARTVAAG